MKKVFMSLLAGLMLAGCAEYAMALGVVLAAPPVVVEPPVAPVLVAPVPVQTAYTCYDAYGQVWSVVYPCASYVGLMVVRPAYFLPLPMGYVRPRYPAFVHGFHPGPHPGPRYYGGPHGGFHSERGYQDGYHHSHGR